MRCVLRVTDMFIFGCCAVSSPKYPIIVWFCLVIVAFLHEVHPSLCGANQSAVAGFHARVCADRVVLEAIDNARKEFMQESSSS